MCTSPQKQSRSNLVPIGIRCSENVRQSVQKQRQESERQPRWSAANVPQQQSANEHDRPEPVESEQQPEQQPKQQSKPKSKFESQPEQRLSVRCVHVEFPPIAGRSECARLDQTAHQTHRPGHLSAFQSQPNSKISQHRPAAVAADEHAKKPSCQKSAESSRESAQSNRQPSDQRTLHRSST